jgi:hypothetical protein
MKIFSPLTFVWKLLPSPLRYILCLFISTRAALLIIGITAHLFMRPSGVTESYLLPATDHLSPLLSMWGVWDTGSYLDIATNGYKVALPFDSFQFNTLAFFPLYPYLIHLLHAITHIYPYTIGLIVANLALIAASYYFYLLLRIDYNETFSRRALLYLYLFPSAFILSGVYPESLLLLFVVMCFYYARKKQWRTVAGAGFLLALTKPVGILILPSLIVILYQQYRNKQKPFFPTILWLLALPLGILTFCWICYSVTGDPLAFMHLEHNAWGRIVRDPFSMIWWAIHSNDISSWFSGWFAVIALCVLTAGVRRIPFSYWLFAALILLAGPTHNQTPGEFRYACGLFPFAIIATTLTDNPEHDRFLSTFLTLLQGCLFVFWTLGFWFMS